MTDFVWVVRQVHPPNSFVRVYDTAEHAMADKSIAGAVGHTETGVAGSAVTMRDLKQGEWVLRDTGDYWRKDTVIIGVAGVALEHPMFFTLNHEAVRGAPLAENMSRTDQIILLTGAVDLRGKLPRREKESPYRRRREEDFVKYVNWYVIHHSGSAGEPTAVNVADYQTGGDSHYPFPEIAYHFYIWIDGTIDACHDIETLTWANGAGSPMQLKGVGINNWKTIAVCFAGATPNHRQLASIEKLGDAIDKAVGKPLKRLGHRDVSINVDMEELTECPGSDYKDWIDKV